MKRVFIVAEIGCNHNGSKDLAKKMVVEAKACGVDAVKFQTFKASDLISCYAPKAEYQKETTGTADSQLEMTAKLELSHEDLMELKAHAESLGLIVFSTPFDMGSIEFLDSIVFVKFLQGKLQTCHTFRKLALLKEKGKELSFHLEWLL